jgi:hypothetical protein
MKDGPNAGATGADRKVSPRRKLAAAGGVLAVVAAIALPAGVFASGSGSSESGSGGASESQAVTGGPPGFVQERDGGDGDCPREDGDQGEASIAL